MNSEILKKVEGKYYQNRPEVNVGDTVELHLKITEGNKVRVQIFKGIIIAMKGVGLSKNLVVRKISYGIGVEKIVPLHSPTLDKIVVIKKGSIRKSKLYYMRERIGKKAMKVKPGNKKEIQEEKIKGKIEGKKKKEEKE